MTNFLRRTAFDRPFEVCCVDGEVLMVSRQAPVELVLTPDSARATALRLLLAAQNAANGAEGATPESED